MRVEEADVVVVGAGPVGLTLAIDLAGRGVKVIVAETRRRDQPPSVKCNHVAARSMEQYRRLGIAAKIRDAGLPADFPNDVVFRTSVTGIELTRIPIPCRADRYTSREGPDTDWPTAEPPHRINQLFFEPILLAHAATLANVSLRHRTRVDSFEQVAGATPEQVRVAVAAVDLDSGESLAFRGRYLVGCDGGSSTVRRQIGAHLEGTPVIQRVQSTYIRAPGLAALIPGKRAWSYYSVNPRRCGTMFAINGHDSWLVHNHLNPDELEFDSVDRDTSIRTILGVAPDFRYEVISKEDWVGRRLVADRFRAGNVFLAGDAAHLWVPYAGFGMNAGIADAVNLAWLLGGAPARLGRRADPRRLRSRAPANHRAGLAVRDGPCPEDDQGARRRADAHRGRWTRGRCPAGRGGRRGLSPQRRPVLLCGPELRLLLRPLADHRRRRRESAGLLDGLVHRVDRSRLPGAAFLARRRTLAVRRLRTRLHAAAVRPHAAIDILVEAAAALRLPLAVVEVDAPEVPAAYRHKLVLCRGDQHVVWRGDAAPALPARLFDALRGAGA